MSGLDITLSYSNKLSVKELELDDIRVTQNHKRIKKFFSKMIDVKSTKIIKTGLTIY